MTKTIAKIASNKVDMYDIHSLEDSDDEQAYKFIYQLNNHEKIYFLPPPLNA